MLQNLFNYLGKIASLKDDVKNKITQVVGEDPKQFMFNYFDKLLRKDQFIKAVRGETNEVVIPSNCHYLYKTFNDVSTLEKVTIEPVDSLKIGQYTFYNTSLNQLNSDTPGIINIPEGVLTLGNYSFYGTSSHRSLIDCKVIFPQSLTGIGRAFDYCDIVEADFSKCVNLVDIGATYAFSQCRKLKTLDFSNCVKIKEFLIHTEGMAELTSLVLPPNCTRLGMIRQTTKLEYVRIPNTVTKISNYSLGYGIYNDSVIFDFGNTRSTIPTLDGTTVLSKNCKAIVPDALYDDWIQATNWSVVASKIVKYSDYYTN